MTSLFPTRSSGASELSSLLSSPDVLQVPGCFDALSARIIEQAGFRASFLGGFSMSAHILASMQRATTSLLSGESPQNQRVSFDEARALLG